MISKSINHKTILIADSSRDNLNTLGKYLKTEGFNILAAIDGKQAFGIVQSKQPHLVLLDAEMPVTNGFELCQSIKKSSTSQGVAVIIMSELADAFVIERAFASGADDFISKPCHTEGLVERIHAVLEHQNKAGGQNSKSDVVRASKHVLLVEDNELNQNYVEAIIQDLGFTVDIAEDGGIGLENISTKQYDLLLMDINVPVINGVELTKIIRSKYSKDLPIIAISGHADKETIDRCLNAGMNGFVTKPFTAKELKGAVLKLFPQLSGAEERRPFENVDVGQHRTKSYNYDHAIEIAKGDDELLKKWIIRLNEILKSGLENVNLCVRANEFPDKNQIFHELVNYSGYFGLDELRSYIQELNSIKQFSNDRERIGNFYRKIGDELLRVKAYYNNIV